MKKLNDRNDESAGQEQLLPFLLDPKSYPHRPKRVRLAQTHSSFVFLAPPFVYKLKKPVNFGFLDFSTLEKRRYFCEREVELNKRLCPEIYLGVVAISKRSGQFTFDPGGEVMEYAVKMRKLSERYFLDKLTLRGAVRPADLNRIAAALKTFYLAQHPTEKIEAWGRIDHLKISTEENFRQTQSFLGRTLSKAAFETIRFYTDEFYGRQAELFAARVREGWIRDCHGDLHLEHIHLTPRALHIYDCIEFNDRFRYIDVANDAAFLAMDLDFRNRPDLARHFASKMAAVLHDPGMGRLMDFYKCYRAYVRGKVESLQSLAPAAPKAERTQSEHRAQRYFRLALQYAAAGSEPMVLVVMGRIASGKSTLAHALAAELDWPVFSSDRIRKQLAGTPLFQRGSTAARAQLYSPSMTQKTYQELLAAATEHLQQKRGVVLDATFARRAHRELFQERFASQGIPMRFIETQADAAAVKKRLRERETLRKEISDARLEDFDALAGIYEAPTELTENQLLAVRTAGPLEETLICGLRKLVLARFGG